MKAGLIMAALCCVAVPTAAQDSAPQTDAEWMNWVPSADSVDLPQVTFEEDQADRDNYEKYYYFQRADTSFADALADLRECDAHARGLFRGSINIDTTAAMMQYGALAGGAGGIIGGVIADAILGPAELRRKRRINMRRCMFFKGYSRFGLDETLWEAFNFEEGARDVAEADRQQMIAMQARVASGPRPSAEELGL